MSEENIKYKWQWQILESDLPAPARHLMLTLSVYMNPDGSKCFPSISELAGVTGLSPNTVRKHIRLAIKKEYLRAENAGNRGAKSQQMQYFPILNKTGVQEMHPSIDRGSGDEGLYPERGSNGEQRGSAGEQRGSGDAPNHIINNTLPNNVEHRLSEKLFLLIQKRNPKHKKPDFQKWGVHIDRLIRLDNRTPEEIEKVIEWCQSHDFWQNNILSTDTLRKEFDRLFLQMGSSQPKTPKSCRPTGVVT